MGKPTGFKEYERKKVEWRLPVVRLNDYDENLYRTQQRAPGDSRRSLHGLWRTVLPIGDWLPD